MFDWNLLIFPLGINTLLRLKFKVKLCPLVNFLPPVIDFCSLETSDSFHKTVWPFAVFLMFLKSVLQREEVSKSFTPNRSLIAFGQADFGPTGQNILCCRRDMYLITGSITVDISGYWFLLFLLFFYSVSRHLSWWTQQPHSRVHWRRGDELCGEKYTQ